MKGEKVGEDSGSGGERFEARIWDCEGVVEGVFLAGVGR